MGNYVKIIVNILFYFHYINKNKGNIAEMYRIVI